MRPVQEQTASGRIELDYCPKCRGVFFDRGELEAVLQLEGSEAFSPESPLLAAPEFGPASLLPGIPCPRLCKTRMHERVMPTARARFMSESLSGTGDGAGEKTRRGALHIDLCPHCAGIWLDGGELAAISEALRDPRLHPLLVPQPPPDFDLRPPSAWVWLFMFFTGLPVETWQPRARRPLLVIALIVVCCALFGLELWGDPEQLIRVFGLIPARLWHGDFLPLLTHMFLHGGPAHLLGNMYFLWIFGDNVEDRLGDGRFVLLYLLSGLGAALLHCLLSADPATPVVGASGAISGVMAAYALLFPQARLVSLIFVFQVRWKTSTYLFLWLALQLGGAIWGTGHVAWWAHVGGFLVGAALVWNKRPAAARARLQNATAWSPLRSPLGPPGGDPRPASLPLGEPEPR